MINHLIKNISLKILFFLTCLIIVNCSSVKSNQSVLLKKGIEFDFKPNGFKLATTGNGYVDVYSNKLEVQIEKGTIRINPRYKRFKTSSAYALRIGISKYIPGTKHFNMVAESKILKIDKIFESRKDSYDISNLVFTIPNVRKQDLKNSRITLKIYSDNTYSRTNYAHTNEKNTIFDLFDF